MQDVHEVDPSGKAGWYRKGDLRQRGSQGGLKHPAVQLVNMM